MHCNILINDLIDFEFRKTFYLHLPYHQQTKTKLELSHLCVYHRAHLAVNIVLSPLRREKIKEATLPHLVLGQQLM